MQGGFSFCGVDIAKFGLEYVPPLDQTYVFGGAPYEVHQETFDAHHGGYFYGTTVQPKDFTLKCLYQDLHIAHGSLTAIENFFRRGKTGRLVFAQRDWLWYTATVVGILLHDVTADRPQGTLLKKAYINTAVAQNHCGMTYDATVKTALPMIVFE